MKKWIFVFLSVTVWACNSVEEKPEPVSTVDSNLADPEDTLLPELYLDPNTQDTSFSIALDSAGPTILPNDTNYNNRN